jgi:hypothetical protein
MAVSNKPSIKRPAGTSGVIFGKKCPVCSGKLLSPSSQDGTWTPDPRKALLKEELKSKMTILADLESQMGLGGSEIKNISKHKIETIGLIMNDFGSIRVDKDGKINRNEVVIHPLGTFVSQKESPLVEYVHVDDLPGGTYTLNVGNRFNCQVGSGGVSIKSFGPVDLGGTITNITGEQVNVSSQNEVNIDGGKRLNIVADILTIRQRNQKQVLVDSNLGVSQNVIVGGGMHVEGELSVNHITAPVEVQQTEETVIRGFGISGKVFGYAVHKGFRPVYGNGSPDTIEMHPHSHHFKNIPLTLKNSNMAVRTEVSDLNNSSRVSAKPVVHEKK